MLINDSTINDAPLNDEVAVFGRLKLGALDDTLSPEDGGRVLGWDVTATATLDLLESLISDVTLGGSDGTINEKLVSEVLIASEGGLLLSRYRDARISESVTLLEAMLASRLRFSLTGESIITLDLSPLTRYRGALFTDFAAIVDAAVKERNLTRLFTEVVALTDQILWQRVKPRLSGDAVIVSDDGRSLGWDVLVDASVTVIDELISSVVNGGGAIVRVASDTILVTDGTARALLRGRTLLEALTLQEGGLDREIGHTVDVSESIDLPDSFLLRRLRTIMTSEGISILDMLLSSTSGIRVITNSDLITVGDSTLIERFRGRTASDVFGLTEQQLHSLQRLMTLVEGVTFSEDQLRVMFYDRRATDSLTVFDQLQSLVGYAVLYDVRSILGRAPPVAALGRAIPIALLSRATPIAVLGGYN